MPRKPQTQEAQVADSEVTPEVSTQVTPEAPAEVQPVTQPQASLKPLKDNVERLPHGATIENF